MRSRNEIIERLRMRLVIFRLPETDDKQVFKSILYGEIIGLCFALGQPAPTGPFIMSGWEPEE
jgi:hypothetical protein